jgi:hypothetical protein
VTDYILTASRFDQIVERYDDGRPKRTIKHRRGATVTGLPESEVDRLLAAGAIAPATKPKGKAAKATTDESGTGDVVVTYSSPAAREGDTAPSPPAKTAKTEEWQEYAKARGMDPAEADAKSRAELIAIYLGGEAQP